MYDILKIKKNNEDQKVNIIQFMHNFKNALK